MTAEAPQDESVEFALDNPPDVDHPRAFVDMPCCLTRKDSNSSVSFTSENTCCMALQIDMHLHNIV